MAASPHGDATSLYVGISAHMSSCAAVHASKQAVFYHLHAANNLVLWQSFGLNCQFFG